MNSLIEERAQLFMQIHDAFALEWPNVRSKPILGGALGKLGLRIATRPSYHRGLDSVSYFVMTGGDGPVAFTMGDSKAAALGHARDFLECCGADGLNELVDLIRFYRSERERMRMERIQAEREARKAQEPSIPKRRLQIFEKSAGQCHYCGEKLSLHGKWHIEHKMPKALMGGNEPSNLVASCVSCNHKKRDKTAEEFIHQRNQQRA